jgi:lipopolysaccharide heptosyltransferase I
MKRLLIVKLSSFGDVLHALPVVKSIKQDLPDVSIDWVVRERCAGLLKNCDFIDHVDVLGKKPGFAELVRLRSVLHRRKYDTAFDMQGLFLSGLITALSGAARRVGLNRNREMNAMFLTEASVDGKTALTHAVKVQMGFRQSAGLPEISILPALTHLGSSSDDWLEPIISSLGGKSAVVLNVGASTIYKRWPNEQWIALANKLTNKRCHVILTAGPSEAEDAHLITEGISLKSSVTDLGGVTTSDQLATVLARADLVISGDTGPMHLSAALGTPTIALFGPTDPRLTGPFGPNHKTIWKQLACSPCFRHPTCSGRVDCLKQISVEEVFQAANNALDLHPRGVLS